MQTSHRIAAALVAGFLAFSIPLAALAQGRNRAGRVRVVPPHVMSKLNLTADQQNRLRAAGEAFRAEMQMSRELPSRQERRQVVRKAADEYRSVLNATLNPSQQKQLQSLMEQSREYRGLGQMGARLSGLKPPLSQGQKAKIQEITARYEPQIRSARRENRGAADRTAGRQRVRELAGKMRAELLAVLTPEQKAQLRTTRRAGRVRTM